MKADSGAEAPTLTEGEDYSAFYDESTGACVIELLEEGTAYSATALTVEAGAVDPAAVTEGDVAAGVAQVDACMNRTGLTPDLLLAPGWSQKPAIAALLAVKAGSVSTLLGAKALVDIDSTEALASAGLVAGMKQLGEAYMGTVQAAGAFAGTISNVEALSGASTSEMAALTAQAKDGAKAPGAEQRIF